MSYTIALPDLAERVAAIAPTPKRDALLAALRAADPCLSASTLATRRDGSWLDRRKVLTNTGELVHDDHRAFLQAEIDAAGSAVAAMQRLRDRDYRLTECGVSTLYVISDQGGAQDDFVQALVDVEDEFVDRRLFSDYDESWRASADLGDLCRAAEDGPLLEDAARSRYRPTAYRLRRIIDFAAFMREASAVHTRRREAAAGKVLHVTDLYDDGRPSVARDRTVAELDPGLRRFAWPGQRLFDDWSASSAGRSGARLCRSWVFQTSDYTDPGIGERSMSFVPAWTHVRKIAAIEARPTRSAYELYGKLEALDRRVGVPFAWYFYMLHGNLVQSWAGERVLKAAEAGLIVLPEHDYRVLKRWSVRGYGF